MTMDETTAEILERMENTATDLVQDCQDNRYIAELTQHLADIQEITKRFAVAGKVVTELWACRHGNGLDGQDIADMLLQCGAAKYVTVTEPCTDEGCLCSEREFPTGCLRLPQGGGE